MVVDMEIKRLKNTKFGTSKIARVVTGWALYEAGKGWIAFSSDRDSSGSWFLIFRVAERRRFNPSWTPAASSASTEWNMSQNYKGPKGLFFYTFSCIIENISFCF